MLLDLRGNMAWQYRAFAAQCTIFIIIPYLLRYTRIMRAFSTDQIQAMSSIYRQVIIFTIIALLNACANIPKISPEQRAALEQPARQFMAQGAWPKAAIAWQQAANQATGTLAADYRLNAAKALLQAGDSAGTRAIIRALKSELSTQAGLRRRLILAEADLLDGRAQASLQRLGPLLATQDRALLAQYHRLRAQALLADNQLLAAIRERAVLESVLEPGPELYSNRQSLWNLLSTVDEAQLESFVLRPLDPFSGWVDLAKRVHRHQGDVTGLQNTINEWNLSYPAHPAGEQIIPQLLEQALVLSQPPNRIALLLPLSGPFKDAAKAIRDGLMAAWHADSPNPNRPSLMFRDSSQGDISDTYNEAVASGAQFIIGPLAKQQVGKLLQEIELQTPTLALNYPEYSTVQDVPKTAPGRSVFQYALAPEDDAAVAAEFAYSAGYQNAAILAPKGPWGERVGNAFKESWIRLGGQVVAQQDYSDNAKEVSGTVKRLLNFDQSEERARRIRRVLVRKLKHDAEPRHDIDFLFMAAFPQAARQIKPLLRFYRAGDLPVIATSHAFTGIRNASVDQDLNGLEFADMPWILSPDRFGLPALVTSTWPTARGGIGRLYAFGADAYTLATKPGALRNTRTQKIPGLTGTLWLDENNRVKRELQWAVFVQGVPEGINPAQ